MSSWLDAETLSERLAALRVNPYASEFFDGAQAETRLAEWKALTAFEEEGSFERRLALEGCTEREFRRVLGTPADRVFPDNHLPDWLDKVFAAERAADRPFTTPSLESYVARGMIAPFLPLVRYHARRLSCSAKTADLLIAPVLGRIEYLSRRAIALEINVQRVLGRLEGETSEARFASFSRRLTEPGERLTFLRKYPVLTRSMQRVLELWVDASEEFLGRLAEDDGEIRAAFGIAPDDSLAGYDAGAGDIHCRGRSVAILTFQSGKKIIYKPRPLSIDVHFQSLLRRLNDLGLEPPLRTIGLVARETHGWVEFVENFPCRNEAEVTAFYRRLGSLLAILHSLATVDMHFENLVAAGPDPVIVDLETLFHGSVEPEKRLTASDVDAARIRESVMSVGLLPAPTVAEGNRTFDVSGMGASVGQTAPYKVLWLQNLGKDDVHIAHINGWIPRAHNRPTEAAIPVPDFLAGFESAARFLLKHKEELLDPNGPVACFASDEGRLVIRPTRLYGSLGMDAAHPDLLRDDLDRARHWDYLWNGVRNRPRLEKFIASELRQIEEGDIPFFSIGTRTRDAVGADGTTIPDAIHEAGLSRAMRRIEALSPERIEEESWFIRASMGYLGGYARKPRHSSARAGTYLDAARDAGDEVMRSLSSFAGTASCLNVACITGENDEGKGAYSISTAGAGLYEGLGGIALFLAYLARESGDGSYREAAEALTRNIQQVHASRKRPWRMLSGFSGLGSLVYLYTHLGALWDRPDLFDAAEALLPDLSPLVESDETFDVLSGSAGCLLAALPLARVRPRGGAAELARLCGERLRRRCWTSLPFRRGISHGAAGIALALHELGLAGEAREAVAFERAELAEGKWTDRHVINGRPQVSWCHGAPGIALARLGMYRAGGDPELRRDIESALKETREGYWMPSQCICHGSLGNLEPLVVATAEFPELGDWSAFIDEAAKRVLGEIERTGWKSMLPNQTLSNGLMTGLSGIGYAFLRLNNPGGVPSVLSLAGPPVGLENDYAPHYTFSTKAGGLP